jgi:hypothetical protein
MTEQLTARDQIIRFVEEWTHAAGAPLRHVRETLGPLLDAYASEVTAKAECTKVHVWDDVPVNPDGSGVPWKGTPSDPTTLVQLHRTPDCMGATYFDRTVCPEPCGMMHYRCGACGGVGDPCCWESAPVDATVFGRIVRRIRKRRGMTRAELANYLYPDGHSTKDDIKRIERGEVVCTPGVCRRLAWILGVSMTVDGTSLDAM